MTVFSRKLFLGLTAIGLCGPLARGETIVHDFSVGWTTANPDGAYDRPTIGINGQWPIPVIRASVGDRLVINVHNALGNASTSLHFHGLFQNGTNHMDGAVGVNQCAIPPGESFIYDFTIDQPGTYWYHAHNNGQYVDGLRGPMIVHDPKGPYEGKYDEEILISLSDWYHQAAPDLINELINVENPTGAEPIPQAALLNDTQNLKVHVKPDTTYLVRLVNMGGFASQYVWFEGHSMQVVEVDGVWTKEAEADMLYITPAQRYSVLLKTGSDVTQNFAIVGAMDEELFDDPIPEDLQSNVTGWLVYDDKKPLPEPTTVAEFEVFDDFDLVPYDGQKLLENVDHTVTLDVKMDNLRDGANYAFFNDMTYVSPKVPSLYTALSVGAGNATDHRVYGTYTLPFVLKRNEVVELVLNNADDGRHPFHLHGHNFQVVARSEEDEGDFVPEELKRRELPAVPMRRDTLYAEGNGHFVVRFRADNPGVWLFHCHIEWHLDQGLVTTFVEAPEALEGLPVPKSHYDICKAAGIPTKGNAAGNVRNVLDLTGENRPPPALPEGFTPKGYVALFFSTLGALLGLVVITGYGLIEPIKKDVSAESAPLIDEEE